MISPSSLVPGDTIAIVSTARKVERDCIEKAVGIFETWGLRVKTGRHLFSEYHQFAGTDEQRASDLQEMLDDDRVKAIVCARGGYGTVRIIDRIDFSAFVRNPKWIAGFSDVTVLHSHIHRNFGIETLHSMMAVNVQNEEGLPKEALDSLRSALFGKHKGFSFSAHPLNRQGKCRGILTGGNLSILYSLAGSRSDVTTEGKILFIEDLDEYLYHVDRMMMNLKRSGKLEKLSGLVVGGMTGMNDNPVPFGKIPEEIILEAVEEYDYPVFFSVPAGHIFENRVLILGRESEIVSDENVTLYQ